MIASRVTAACSKNSSGFFRVDFQSTVVPLSLKIIDLTNKNMQVNSFYKGG